MAKRNCKLRSVEKKDMCRVNNDETYRCLAAAIERGEPPSQAKINVPARWQDYSEEARASAHHIFRGREHRLNMGNVYVPHKQETQERILWGGRIVVILDEIDEVCAFFRNALREEIERLTGRSEMPSAPSLKKRIAEFYAGFTYKGSEIPKDYYSSVTYCSRDGTKEGVGHRSENTKRMIHENNTRRIINLEINMKSLVTHIEKTTDTTILNLIDTDNDNMLASMRDTIQGNDEIRLHPASTNINTPNEARTSTASATATVIDTYVPNGTSIVSPPSPIPSTSSFNGDHHNYHGYHQPQQDFFHDQEFDQPRSQPGEFRTLLDAIESTEMLLGAVADFNKSDYTVLQELVTCAPQQQQSTVDNRQLHTPVVVYDSELQLKPQSNPDVSSDAQFNIRFRPIEVPTLCDDTFTNLLAEINDQNPEPEPNSETTQFVTEPDNSASGSESHEIDVDGDVPAQPPLPDTERPMTPPPPPLPTSVSKYMEELDAEDISEDENENTNSVPQIDTTLTVAKAVASMRSIFKPELSQTVLKEQDELLMGEMLSDALDNDIMGDDEESILEFTFESKTSQPPPATTKLIAESVFIQELPYMGVRIPNKDMKTCMIMEYSSGSEVEEDMEATGDVIDALGEKISGHESDKGASTAMYKPLPIPAAVDSELPCDLHPLPPSPLSPSLSDVSLTRPFSLNIIRLEIEEDDLPVILPVLEQYELDEVQQRGTRLILGKRNCRDCPVRPVVLLKKIKK